MAVPPISNNGPGSGNSPADFGSTLNSAMQQNAGGGEAGQALDKMITSMLGNLFQESMQHMKQVLEEPIQEAKDAEG